MLRGRAVERLRRVVERIGAPGAPSLPNNTTVRPVANCMLEAVKQTPFSEVDKCWDAMLTIPVTFPTPPRSAACRSACDPR
jgi:hypothetical protein